MSAYTYQFVPYVDVIFITFSSVELYQRRVCGDVELLAYPMKTETQQVVTLTGIEEQSVKVADKDSPLPSFIEVFNLAGLARIDI